MEVRTEGDTANQTESKEHLRHSLAELLLQTEKKSILYLHMPTLMHNVGHMLCCKGCSWENKGDRGHTPSHHILEVYVHQRICRCICMYICI